MKLLTLHIGLPKTGTSSLQTGLFRRLPELAYIGRASHVEHPESGRYDDATVTTDPIRKTLRQAAQKPLVKLPASFDRAEAGLISEELISLMPEDIWGLTPAVAPELLAVNMRRFAIALKVRLRVLVTIRRQPEWLASRYAESAKRLKNPGQDDFEASVRDFLATDIDQARRRWLTYAHVWEVFAVIFGAQNVMVQPLERYAADPGDVEDELARFITGRDDAAVPPAPAGATPEPVHNSLAAEAGTWSLRFHEGTTITLTDPLANEILAQFGPDNQRLAGYIGQPLDRYGYY